MPRHVLDVGNCGPDHFALRRLIEGRFGAVLERADTGGECLERLARGGIDLVLINRKLDIDYSDGIEVLRQIKADERLAGVPVMLITNYAEHQEAAVAEGALAGFGKLELAADETLRRLAQVLGPPGH